MQSKEFEMVFLIVVAVVIVWAVVAAVVAVLRDGHGPRPTWTGTERIVARR